MVGAIEIPTALRAIAWELADDELLVAHGLSTQIGWFAPDVEEHVALASVAQDELGHARYLIAVLEGNEALVDQAVYARPLTEFHCCWLAEVKVETSDWAGLVVRQWLYDEADQIRLSALGELATGEFQSMVSAMLREESLHVRHWRWWVDLIASDPQEGRPRFEAALQRIWPLTGDFFASPAWASASLPEALTPASQARRWYDQVASVLLHTGLRVPEPWEEWAVATGTNRGRAGQHSADCAELVGVLRSYVKAHPGDVWK